MNKYVKEFLKRGLIFGGFGPIILSIIYFIIGLSKTDFSLKPNEVVLGTISIYILAFIHAGASIFNQIESWSVPKSLLAHLSCLYFAYLLCYLINTWIAFDIKVIIIFTLIFIISYFIIWITVYLIVKRTSKQLNSKLNN